MHTYALLLSGLFTLGLAGCVAPVDIEPGEVTEERVEAVTGAAAEASAYYIVTRVDTRKCAYPRCGGYFVKRVNQDVTRCADGVSRGECHVAEVDLSPLGLPAADTEKFTRAYGEGFGLLRGELTRVKNGSGVKVETLVASEAWVAQAMREPQANFYRVTGTGVRCFTTPCPTFHEEKLNSAVTRSLAEMDLATSGAGEEQLDAGYEAALHGGILVAGKHHWVSGPGGSMRAIEAIEYYLPLTASPGEPESADKR